MIIKKNHDIIRKNQAFTLKVKILKINFFIEKKSNRIYEKISNSKKKLAILKN